LVKGVSVEKRICQKAQRRRGRETDHQTMRVCGGTAKGSKKYIILKGDKIGIESIAKKSHGGEGRGVGQESTSFCKSREIVKNWNGGVGGFLRDAPHLQGHLEKGT